jgi:4-amino-4-deoxy-L-arabinose transferase-like glycosyltransferase
MIFYRKGHDRRTSFLAASLVWGVFLTLITEVLSLFDELCLPWLLSTWGVLTIFLLLIFSKLLPSEKKTKKMVIPKMSGFLKAVTIGILSIVFLTLITALVAPPNTSDSMTYHMARVVHWIQNQSVAHYQTNITRQLWLPPWAEYAITHFFILANGDLLANLIQWFSMLGCLIGVTLITRELGGDIRAQIFSCAVAVSIPMGILQSSSTQNDYVVSFWIVCLVYFLLRFNKKNSLFNCIGAAAGLGLAILTKGTAYIYSFPFLFLFIVPFFKTKRTKNYLKQWFSYVLIFILLFTIINIGHFVRNTALFGNPVTTDRISMSNDVFTLSTLVSNAIRNISLHTPIPSKPIHTMMATSVKNIHKFLGIKINDPNTTWKWKRYMYPRFTLHEDKSGNPLHLILIVFSIAFGFIKKHLRQIPRFLFYLSCLLLGFFLFCLYLKWQPWHSRLHLPLFVLWAPIIGFVLSTLRKNTVSNVLIVIVLLSSLPWVLCGNPRPLLGKHSIFTTDRITQYFRTRPDVQSSYQKSARFISNYGCSNIGLAINGNDWEYPIWVLIKKYAKQIPRIEHVQVTNKSKRYTPTNFHHCLELRVKNHKIRAAVITSVQNTDLNSVEGTEQD